MNCGEGLAAFVPFRIRLAIFDAPALLTVAGLRPEERPSVCTTECGKFGTPVKAGPAGSVEYAEAHMLFRTGTVLTGCEASDCILSAHVDHPLGAWSNTPCSPFFPLLLF